MSTADVSRRARELAGQGVPCVIATVVRAQRPASARPGNAAVVLGAIGDASHVAVLQPLLHDRNRDVVRAAERAIQRIKMGT